MLTDLTLDGNSAYYGGALYVAADLASNATLDMLGFGPENSATRGVVHTWRAREFTTLHMGIVPMCH